MTLNFFLAFLRRERGKTVQNKKKESVTLGET